HLGHRAPIGETQTVILPEDCNCRGTDWASRPEDQDAIRLGKVLDRSRLRREGGSVHGAGAGWLATVGWLESRCCGCPAGDEPASWPASRDVEGCPAGELVRQAIHRRRAHDGGDRVVDVEP